MQVTGSRIAAAGDRAGSRWVAQLEKREMLEECQLPRSENRHHPRDRSALPLSLRARGAHAQPAALWDLSCSGCRIEGVRVRGDETAYWVRLPGIESKAARVVWSNGSEAGFEFERPLHPAVARQITAPGQTVHTADNPAPLAEACEPASVPGLSRREQIIAGYVLPGPGILLDKKPLAGGNSMMGLVRRTSRRTSDHRSEARFAPPEAACLGFAVDDRPAQLSDISPSGIGLVGDLAREIGEEVQLRFAGCEPMAAQIVWKRPGLTGLALPAGAIDLTVAD